MENVRYFAQIKKTTDKHYLVPVILLLCLLFIIVLFLYGTKFLESQNQLRTSLTQNEKLSRMLDNTQKAYFSLSHQNQYKINQQLKEEIKKTRDSYTNSINTYQQILDLQSQKQDTSTLIASYAAVVKDLSDLNFAVANTQLASLNGQIQQINAKMAAAAVANSNVSAPPQPLLVNNSPPGSGFSQQSVQTDTGTFTVDIIAANLNSTRVIADTASNGDCSNNCPVMPLADYISRSNAYAGINGTFFCPSDYPSCAGKTGSFDTLLMNKNKVYFNSANNVYSTVPAVIFSGSTARFITASEQWGRDTSPDSVIAMQPLLVFNGQIVYNGSNVGKYESSGTRSFIANKGSMAYIGFVLDATMEDSAHVMHALGMDNALNLDEGGSTALWFGGNYILGPGRNIPNAVLFVSK
jgi:exopolysaccharide biosynthesis protein